MSFETIILLTGAIEAAALAGMLGIRNPRIDVKHVATVEELDAFDTDELSRARLIAFATDVIVPSRILDSLGYGAYNFHPGPPSYPGWGPAHFAIYDGAATFGVTAHVMIGRVDAGPVVAVDMFSLPPGTSVARLEQLAFAALARVFWALAQALTQPEPLTTQPIAWSGVKSTRRLHQAMREIPATITKDDLDRRVAAFGDGGEELTVTLHGHRFRYVAPEADTAVTVAEPLHVERFVRSA